MKVFEQINGRLGAVILAMVLVMVLLPIHQAKALAPNERGGMIFGIGLGYSPGKVTFTQGTEGDAVATDWKTGATPQIRIGYAVIRDRLSLTLTNQQWMYEQGILADDKLRVNTQNWSLVFTYFPGNPQTFAGGIYILAGGGISNSRLTLLEPSPDDPYGNMFEEVFKQDERGTSYQIGAGYEFRLTRLFAAGVSVSYIHHPVDGAIFQDTTAIPVNLTLNWYW